MRARKTLRIVDNQLKTFATGDRSCAKTNVNSMFDVTDLDQIGPISVQDV